MSDSLLVKQRWIITGANGYLGGQLCEILHDLGKCVLGVARAGKSLKHLEKRGIPCHTYDELSSLLKSDDIFVHCAGKVSNSRCLGDYVKINKDWSLALFKQGQKRGIRCFIYISSVAALGYQARSESTVLNELSIPIHSKGELYGRSKLLAEQVLLQGVSSGATRLVILRPGLIYGRRPFATSRSWFRCPVVVDADQRIPLIHIDNFAQAVVSVAECPVAQGVFLAVDDEQPLLCDLNTLKVQQGILRYTPWYIGKTGYWLTFFCRCLVRMLRGRAEKNIKAHAVAEYYFHTRRLTYSTEKLRIQVGWKPLGTLESWLEKTSTVSASNRERL